MKKVLLLLCALFSLSANQILAQTEAETIEKQSSMTVDMVGEDIVVTLDMDLDELPEAGLYYNISIADENGEKFRVFDRSFSPAQLQQKQNGETGRIRIREVEVLKRADLNALAQDLVDSGALSGDAEFQKRAGQEQSLILQPCVGVGFCRLYGSQKNGIYSLNGSAFFDARTGCGTSMEMGSYAEVDLEGSLVRDYSYSDQYLDVTRAKSCGSSLSYCQDQAPSRAAYSVTLYPSGTHLVCEQVWPKL